MSYADNEKYIFEARHRHLRRARLYQQNTGCDIVTALQMTSGRFYENRKIFDRKID